MKPSGPVSKSDKKPLPIPLPTELPGALSLEGLPPSVLHSATVEALLQQVDDLTARLKVNLRRNSLLELDLKKAQENLEFLKQRNQSLEMKSLVEREKEMSAERRFAELSQRIKDLEGQLSHYELRLSQSLTESKSLRDQREELEKQTLRFQNLRKRVKSRLRNYLSKKTEALEKHSSQLARDLKVMQEKYQRDASRLEEVSSLLEASSQRLQEKEQEARALHVNHGKELAAQKAQAETEISELKAAVDQKQAKIQALQVELIESEGLFNSNIQLQDRLKSQKEYFELELASLQKDLRSYRTEAKSLALSKDELNAQLAEARGELKSKSEYIKNLEDQLQTAHMVLHRQQNLPGPEQTAASESDSSGQRPLENS